MKGVIYNGQLLASGSVAFGLHQAKLWKQLDQHLAQVHKNAVQRGEIPFTPQQPTHNPVHQGTTA